LKGIEERRGGGFKTAGEVFGRTVKKSI